MQDHFGAISEIGDQSYYSLIQFSKNRKLDISRLPFSLRIILESLIRNFDGVHIQEEDVLGLCKWNPSTPSDKDLPFVVSRVILQDFTGVPLLADLAAMRDAVTPFGLRPDSIEPVVPVDLIIDHSVQVDRARKQDAFLFNLEIEFQRNQERYEFLKWGQNAFKTFNVVPPGIGIVHQINLELLAHVVTKKNNLLFFDTVVGTDSHTTMINGLGVLGWGVGGIEAEVAMLGLPYFFQTPEVIGVCLSGSLKEGVTATDLALSITELLRKEKVVGKFVEFFGEGASSLSVADRATLSNMAPEYGATIGFFPADQKTLDYLEMTGRSKDHTERVKLYLEKQGMFGIPKQGDIDFSKEIYFNLSDVKPCVSGPKRPQDRIDLSSIKEAFEHTLSLEVEQGGYAKKGLPKICVHSEGHFHLQEPHIVGGSLVSTDKLSPSESEMVINHPLSYGVINPGYTQHLSCDITLSHGSIVIAAITSCTNTSNPSVMIAAGLLAKKAVERGLQVNPKVKTSLAPGSRVVTDYLEKTGLQPFLNQLGFNLVAYGCTTCIGNSGPLDENIEMAIKEHDLITASVLSGNRNFEARIHGSVRANFLMSPPLVVAFALAGRINIDFQTQPIGYDSNQNEVFLKEIWPSNIEIEDCLKQGLNPEMFRERYLKGMEGSALWQKIPSQQGPQYLWKEESTYIQRPPFFDFFHKKLPPRKKLIHMKPFALFGDSITTDHICPAGSFKASSTAGFYLLNKGLQEDQFNSYGSRRGNHHVMVRGTFANVRIRNQMVDQVGGFTLLMPEEKLLTFFEASEIYQKRGTPLIIFAGKDYGMGSSRDWAAKGTALLGVNVVVAESFERIHRSNLIGMGVLPLEFMPEESISSFKLTGKEEFHLKDLEKIIPKQQVTLEIVRENGSIESKTLLCRLDTQTEIDYYLHGGILPYVLRKII